MTHDIPICQLQDATEYTSLRRPGFLYVPYRILANWKEHGPAYTFRKTLQALLRRSRPGAAKKPGSNTPVRGGEALNLQPGELVEVKPLPEILQTLDPQGRNRGLVFTPEMKQFCGCQFRVYKRLGLMFDETTRQQRKVRDTVLLEGVCCQGEGIGCDKSCFHYWREAWLRRVSSASHTHPCSPCQISIPDRATIPLSGPDINDDDRAAVTRVLEGTQLSLGPRLPEFEDAIARYTSSPFAVAVNSGTSALHLCVKAAGIREGDEVITTPFSFVASANCMLFERAVPIFVDVDPATGNIDPEQIERAITPRTRAILPVHVFGRPCRINEILDAAKRHGLTVIEDSCEALGARVHGRCAGTFGQTGAYAFYPNKQMTTGEGGVIVTGDPDVARLCRSRRNQGRAESGTWLQHERLGYNYRLSDINCALGISQLRRLPQILERRASIAALYNQLLGDIPEIIPPPLDEPDCEISWFVYVVQLQPEFSRERRDQVLQQLQSLRIGCNAYFPAIHLQPFYRRAYAFKEGDFPATERISARTIALPFFNALSTSQMEFVHDSLRRIVSSIPLRRSVAAG